MEEFVFRKGFIQEVHMYLRRDSYAGKDSYKEFTCIYGGNHIGSSHILMEGSYRGRNSYKELTYISGEIHI